LWDPTSGINLPVLTTVGEFLSSVPDGIKQVNEKTSCTNMGIAGGSGGELLQRSAGGIFDAGSKIGLAAARVGRVFSGWGAALALGGLSGVC
jgi:hypothetical protein